MNQNQSIFINRYGGPDVLEFRSGSISDPLKGEIQVEVRYSGINFADIMSRMGLYTTRLKPPYVLGMEIAGLVKKVSSEDLNPYLGKAVVGMCRS